MRLLAWRILRSGSATPLRAVERVAAREGLEARDRALLRRIVGTVLRRRGTLRALAATLGERALVPEAALFAHVGLAQLLFLARVPAHAAVAETVRACHRALGEARARRVRTLLLRVVRERREGASGDARRDLVRASWHFDRPVFRDRAVHPYLWAEDALSMPAPIVKRWAKRHGLERALALAHTFLEEPDLSIVALRGGRDALAAELAAAGIETRAADHPRVLVADAARAGALLRSEPFAAGRASVQGESALRAAELVGAREGELVADLCAAPGGKTVVLASAGARVLAADRSPPRLARAARTLARAAPEADVQLVASDGASALAGARFDAVLIDAPCSNTGVLGARPEARWRFGPATRTALAALQARLLAEGAALVRPGGRLVWSTCSLEPEENAQRVRAFLDAHPGWRRDAEHEALPAPQKGRGPIDGGYAARLVRDRG